MQALVNHHCQLERDTLLDWNLVKITQNWSDVVELPRSSNDARCFTFQVTCLVLFGHIGMQFLVYFNCVCVRESISVYYAALL